MKKYVKPVLEYVELRIEERLAGCSMFSNECNPSGNPANVFVNKNS